MMMRTQISLPDELHRRAKVRAAELGVSFAEYVRTRLADDLDAKRPGPRGEIRDLVGLFDSGGSDIARHKDAYLADAVREEHERHAERAGSD